jgi:hypothetical protein
VLVLVLVRVLGIPVCIPVAVAWWQVMRVHALLEVKLKFRLNMVADVANDLIYCHNISRGNIVENHQSHGRTESHTKMQSDKLGSQDAARQTQVIMDKAYKERDPNLEVKDGHSLVMDKRRKAVRFGTIKVYD